MSDPAMQLTKEAIGAAVGRVPSGCFVLTTRHEDRATGVLVSWVQQASFEPLSVSVAIKQGRPAVSLIEGAGVFALNVISSDPTAMFKHFGKGYSLDEDAFRGLRVQESEFGALLEDCVAHLGCRVTGKMSAGDHDLYVARVVAGQVRVDTRPYTHVRRSGLTY